MIGRLKFEFGDLVNQILDQLPEELFQSETTKFLDPAIGGGQFVKEIEERLRKRGHSDENISKRVFGFESNILAIRYAKNRHGLVGQYFSVSCDNLFVKNDKYIYNNDIRRIMEMKFDVIVGNPPYNQGKKSGASGSGNSIWQNFLTTLWPSLSDEGHVCFVHPPEWRTDRHSRSKKKASSIMFDNQLVWIRAAFPFPGAKCSVDAYVLQKTKKKHQETTWVNNDGSVHNFIIESDTDYLANLQSTVITKILNKVLKHKNESVYGRKAMGGLTVYDKTISGQFTFVHGAKFTEKVHPHPHIHQFNKKVILSDNRAFRPFFDDGVLGIGDHVHYALVNSRQEGEWFIKLVNSRLSRWMQWVFCEEYDAERGAHGGEPWNSIRPFYFIKFIDELTDGSDEYFYQHFNLTSDEISYIESTVK